MNDYKGNQQVRENRKVIKKSNSFLLGSVGCRTVGTVQANLMLLLLSNLSCRNLELIIDPTFIWSSSDVSFTNVCC